VCEVDDQKDLDRIARDQEEMKRAVMGLSLDLIAKYEREVTAQEKKQHDAVKRNQQHQVDHNSKGLTRYRLTWRDKLRRRSSGDSAMRHRNAPARRRKIFG
jgi:hypothetical protein